MLHHFKMIQSRVSNTRRTYCVEPVCKWFSVLKNMCMFQSVYRQIVPIFVWWTEQHLKWKKKKQEARKIAIITEHTQFFYSFFFIFIQNKTRISIEILSTKHHLLFICIHGIEWRWLWLLLLLLLLLQRLRAQHNKMHTHKHILLEFL